MEKAREFQKNIYFFFTDYDKAFDCVDHNKKWKFFKEMEVPDHLTFFLRNLYTGQEATVKKSQLEQNMEQWTGLELRKQYEKAVYRRHPAYLTYMQSTSLKILHWMNHRLESSLMGEISAASDMQMIPL